MTTRKLSLVAATLGLCALVLALQGTRAARPQQASKAPADFSKDALFVVSHVDLVPDALAAATPALQQYVAESRKDPGALRVELLQQADRPNHFTIVSVWANEKAFNAHLAAAHTKEFRAKIQSGLGSPFDERLHHLLP